jgi:hypothetical protein
MQRVEELFQRVREFCLALPNVYEKTSHGAPCFFIEKGGQFVALWDNHHQDGNVAMLVAAPPGAQEALVGSNPAVFYRPPYFGPSGWIGVRLDKGLAWEEVDALVAEGYAYIAAKKRGKK